MQRHSRLDSNSRSRGGTLASRKREEAPRPVLRGASFAPLSVVFQKSVEKSPESDLALAAFIVIFFVYAFGTLVAEWIRREDDEERSRVESELDRDDRRLP
jgi:hypothetical protein